MPPVNSGAGIFFFCAEATGIPPGQIRIIDKISGGIILDRRFVNRGNFFINRIFLPVFEKNFT